LLKLKEQAQPRMDEDISDNRKPKLLIEQMREFQVINLESITVPSKAQPGNWCNQPLAWSGRQSTPNKLRV
jgi:hypothetical protein